MNKRIKKLWIDSLRSDTIKQGIGQLCSLDKQTNQYNLCCLGVLTEIYQSERKRHKKKQLSIKTPTVGPYKIIFSYDSSISHLPKIVRNWSGITNSQMTDLIKLNDVYRFTFPEIADYIEKNL